jgi:nicotinamide riboside transporter PnuC
MLESVSTAVYVLCLQKAIHTVTPGWADWALMLAIAAPVLIVMELYKWLLYDGHDLLNVKRPRN